MRKLFLLISFLVLVFNASPSLALGWKAILKNVATGKSKDFFPSMGKTTKIGVDDLQMACTATIQPLDRASENGLDGEECMTICIPINPPNPKNVIMNSAIGTKAVAFKVPTKQTVVHESTLFLYDRNLDNRYIISCEFE